jgi:hypothetical protein
MHDDSTLLGIFIRDEYYITDDLLSYTKWKSELETPHKLRDELNFVQIDLMRSVWCK